MPYLILSILLSMLQPSSFKETQLKKTRVKVAFEEKEFVVKSYFTNKAIQYNGFNLFIRAFKKEKTLEVWVKAKDIETFTLIQTYQFCSTSGTLGPKRKEGDLQIPEGIYQLNHFNPESNFYLSLGINYPNASDKILSDKKNPGGAIYIHGNCVTIGCIPITDDKIKELYVFAVEARNNGQEKIPIHIFPSKLDEFGVQSLTREFGEKNSEFWRNLKEVYQSFEKTKKLRVVTVNSKGGYILK